MELNKYIKCQCPNTASSLEEAYEMSKNKKDQIHKYLYSMKPSSPKYKKPNEVHLKKFWEKFIHETFL